MDKLTNQPSIHLCTLFDFNFLAQGLALFESVERNTLGRISWTVLALDVETERKLQDINKENLTVISFQSFADEELRSLVGIRPWREICWTSAACLLNFCLRQETEFAFIGYVDADCFFFGNIVEMLEEIPPNKNFAIHEHKFSEDRKGWLQKSGRFNVGVVIGRPSQEYLDCITSWRRRVLERCDVDMQAGRCGDQTYLNDWPSQFTSLHIFSCIGVGVAPWNVNNYEVYELANELFVNDSKVFFFHFHSLQIRKLSKFIYLLVPAAGYELNYVPNKEIYLPYISQLNIAHAIYRAPIRKFSLAKDAKWLLQNGLKGRLVSYIPGAHT